MIHVYAAAYMQDEPRPAYGRFFCNLTLFCASMLLLALGANVLVMFVGREGVGLCSYLLIGFWYEKRSAAIAGFKAVLVNRIGDWGFAELCPDHGRRGLPAADDVSDADIGDSLIVDG